MKIILNPNALAAREIDTAYYGIVPDLWHVAEWFESHPDNDATLNNPKHQAKIIKEAWHLSHDLLNFIRALDSAGGLQVTIERAIDRISEYLQDSEQCGLEPETGREQCEAWAEALQGYAGMLEHFPANDWRISTQGQIIDLIESARAEAGKYHEEI